METHRKGEMTEAVVIAELKRRGVPVAVPFGDNERYDIIVEWKGQLYRVQVKTGRLSDGCVHFHGKSSHTNSTGNVYKTYDDDTDYFAVYCHELEQLYVIGEQEFDTDMRLRVAEPEVEQPSINWADDYEIDERWPPEEDVAPVASQTDSVIRKLRDGGIEVFEPESSDAPYDVLLREAGGELYRVVIHQGSVTNGRVRFATGDHPTPGADEVDYVVVNCEEVDEQYLLDRSAYDRTMSLRIEEPGQEQPSINWAEDYEFDEQWPPTDS